MYRKAAQGWLKHLDFMILDIICLQISFIVAYVIRHGAANPYSIHLYRNVMVVVTLIDIIIVIFFASMKNVLKRGYYKEFTMTLKHVCLVELSASFYLFATQEGNEFSRFTLLVMGLVYILLSYIVRLIWKHHLKRTLAVAKRRSLLIVTSENMVESVTQSIRMKSYEQFRIAGIMVTNQEKMNSEIDGIKIIPANKFEMENLSREWVDEVFVNVPQSDPLPERLINVFVEMGMTVHIRLIKAGEFEGQKQYVERLGNYTVLTTSINMATAGQLVAKRLMDIIGGLVGCVITGILYVVLAPAIYMQSPGPIFFSQIRVGKNGKQFKIFKFRSMYMDAEERKKEMMAENRVKDGMMFKIAWDPRIIGSKKREDGTFKKGIGNVIRDWSLDEFPQFLNVLRGEMSLVGTRPPTIDEWEKYELHHRARLAIKPGITGMWQVSGRSNITDFEDVVELDRKYIAGWSLGLDVKLILRTILVVFCREGAL